MKKVRRCALMQRAPRKISFLSLLSKKKIAFLREASFRPTPDPHRPFFLFRMFSSSTHFPFPISLDRLPIMLPRPRRSLHPRISAFPIAMASWLGQAEWIDASTHNLTLWTPLSSSIQIHYRSSRRQRTPTPSPLLPMPSTTETYGTLRSSLP